MGTSLVVDVTHTFDEYLKKDEILVVKFYSKMCGSCKEFAPIWTEFTTATPSIHSFGEVDIDTAEGMQLAQEMGVLEEGIPNVRVVNTKKRSLLKRTPSIYDGSGTTQPTTTDLSRALKKILVKHEVNEAGAFSKRRKTGAV